MISLINNISVSLNAEDLSKLFEGSNHSLFNLGAALEKLQKMLKA